MALKVKERDLTTGAISEHLKELAIPASMGMFFNTMFNVVDTFYAGKLGTTPLAGMSLSFSIYLLLIAISSGLGTGTGALSSNHLGEKNRAAFEKTVANAHVMALVLALIMTLLGPFIAPHLLTLLGARGAVKAAGEQYLTVLFMGSIFFIANALLGAILSSQGNTRIYRNFLILGFLLNLILDPLFLFGWWGLPKLGTAGVALATVLIQAVGSLYLSTKIIRGQWFDYRRINRTLFDFREIIALTEQGFPASLNMMTVAMGVFVINFFILRHGSDAAAAAYGVAVRIEQIALLPALGLNVATLSIAGQNAGAQKPQRIHTLYKTSMGAGLAIMTLGMVIVYPAAPYLIALFNDAADVIHLGTGYLRIEFLAFYTYILLNVSIAILQGLRKPWWALGIGIYRQLIGAALLFYLLADKLKMGLLGVWWGIVLVNWSAALITVLYTLYTLRRVFEKEEETT